MMAGVGVMGGELSRLLSSLDATGAGSSSRALSIVELVATELSWSASSHTSRTAEGRVEGVGVERVDSVGEDGRDVDGVTGSRSVTTRMVKRGGMEMEVRVQGEVEDGVGTG